MGEILSHSEVEAILSAIDFSAGVAAPRSEASTPSRTSDDCKIYDFGHPEPLQTAELDRLRLASAASTFVLQHRLMTLLRTSVVVNFLGVEQSTFHEYLITAEQPTCLAEFEAAHANGTWLMDISRSLAFLLIDCLLGGTPSRSGVVPARPFTDVETRLIGKTLDAVLPELAVELAPQIQLHLKRVISDARQLTGESTSGLLSGSVGPALSSHEAVALVSFEVKCGLSEGLMQLCLPWKHVSRISTAQPDSRSSREQMSLAAAKVPVIARACIARLKLSARDFAGLTTGDVLLTETNSTSELSMEVDGSEIFRGTPGQTHSHKAIRLTRRIGSQRSKTIDSARGPD